MATIKKNPYSQLAAEKWNEIQALMCHALPRTTFLGDKAETLYLLIKFWHDNLIDYCNTNCRLCARCNRPVIEGLSCMAKAFKEPCEPSEHPIDWDQFWLDFERLHGSDAQVNANTDASKE